MTSWPPLRGMRQGLALAAATLVAIAQASPAAALPLVGIGLNVGAGAQYTLDRGPAVDLTADLAVMGPVIGLQYWRAFQTADTYMQGGLRWNVSPIPMISIAPGVSAVSYNSAFGGLASVNAAFTPLMLPVGIEAMVGAGALANGSTLLPYLVGLKLSFIPFTTINLRYRGWSGSALTTSGPELGLEIGI